MIKFGYFLVEGPHDQEFVGRLLKLQFNKLQRMRQESELNDFWKVLIPRTFPHEGDLLKRMPVPTFFQNADWSIAIQSATGDTNLATTLEDDLASLDKYPAQIGIFLDSDQASPRDRFHELHQTLQQKGFDLSTLLAPGQVCENASFQNQGPLKIGIFVLPDNQSTGTIEEILLRCAQSNYPTLYQAANHYVQGIDLSLPEFKADDKREINKPAGRLKATVSCISNILRPGKSVQVSIQDNRWIDTNTANLPCVQTCMEFIRTLLS